ncbi:MAG: mechanosensitive ion channel domain-containing protein [Patescibacteria group bacterium]
MSIFTALQSLFLWLATNGLRVVVLVFGAIAIDRLIGAGIDKFLARSVKPDFSTTADAERRRAETLGRILHRSVTIALFTIVAMMVLSELGVNIGPLIAGAGIIGIALGLGAQTLVKDAIAGMFILLENSYHIGDEIRLNNIAGAVEDLTLRRTILRDFDGVTHTIPNGSINSIANLTKDAARINIDVILPSSSDVRRMIVILNHVGSELASDASYRSSIHSAPAFFRIAKFDDESVTLKVIGEIHPRKRSDIAFEYRLRLERACEEEGIESVKIVWAGV